MVKNLSANLFENGSLKCYDFNKPRSLTSRNHLVRIAKPLRKNVKRKAELLLLLSRCCILDTCPSPVLPAEISEASLRL
jgi:hypothetical protein